MTFNQTMNQCNNNQHHNDHNFQHMTEAEVSYAQVELRHPINQQTITTTTH
jgi:hypothetical protein